MRVFLIISTCLLIAVLSDCTVDFSTIHSPSDLTQVDSECFTKGHVSTLDEHACSGITKDQIQAFCHHHGCDKGSCPPHFTQQCLKRIPTESLSQWFDSEDLHKCYSQE